MKRSALIIFIASIIICGISCSNKPKLDYSHTFYKDFDFFERKGYNSLKGERIVAPCIEVFEKNDSIITLKIYEEDLSIFKWALVPLNDDVIIKTYTSDDGGFFCFTRTSLDTIFNFYYRFNSPEKLVSDSNSYIQLSDLYPTQISIVMIDEVRYFITEDWNISEDTAISYSFYKKNVRLPFERFVDYSKGFKEYKRKFWMMKYPVVGDFIENIQITYMKFVDENGDYIDPSNMDSTTFDSLYVVPVKWGKKKKYFNRWKSHLEIF